MSEPSGVCAAVLPIPIIGKTYRGEIVEIEDGHETPCWIWQGAVSKGRPVFSKGNRRWVAVHRLVWEERYDETLDSRTPLMRQCPNGLCVNPDHFRKSRRVLGIAPREPVTSEKNRVWHLRRYGLTPEEYEALLEAQGGVCAVCEKPNGDRLGRRLHVDHCHETGLVRGLLCTRCNNAIGHAGESAERLRALADYLEQS